MDPTRELTMEEIAVAALSILGDCFTDNRISKYLQEFETRRKRGR
jgi:hypothetical protein